MNQTLHNTRQRLVTAASVAVIAMMTAPAAHASGSSMPSEAPLQSILESIRHGQNERGIALSRKNALFAGHDAGAENWAIIASLIETCKLNGVDPQAYLTETLSSIINSHKQSQIGELLPWNYPRGDVIKGV